MIAANAQAATTEVVYVIPWGWTTVLLAVVCLALGAILGAWLTVETIRHDEARTERLLGALRYIAQLAPQVGEPVSAAAARGVINAEQDDPR